MNLLPKNVYIVTYVHADLDGATNAKEEKLLIVAPDLVWVESWCKNRRYNWGSHTYEIGLLGSLDVEIGVAARWT